MLSSSDAASNVSMASSVAESLRKALEATQGNHDSSLVLFFLVSKQLRLASYAAARRASMASLSERILKPLKRVANR